ncbi:hypothetical protein OFN32_41675, partial [Escherichia coli]|nr:hypothetical protein [Escherichia coli]
HVYINVVIVYTNNVMRSCQWAFREERRKFNFLFTAKILLKNALSLAAEFCVVTVFRYVHHAAEETTERVFAYEQT